MDTLYELTFSILWSNVGHKQKFYLTRFMSSKAGRKRPETWLRQTAIFVLFTLV